MVAATRRQRARVELRPIAGWQRSEARENFWTDERRVLAPRHDVVVEDVAVRGEDRTVRQIERVVRREIGIMVAGEKGDARRVCGEKREHVVANLRRVSRRRAGAGVERVTVEHEVIDAGEQRAQLRE